MSFRDHEKKRYQAIKHDLFPAPSLVPGKYNDVPRPFCLADDRSADNLNEHIRDDALRYFTDRRIGWHDGLPDAEGTPKGLPSNHLCCSQSACINALSPMLRDANLLARTFRTFLPQLSELRPFAADAPLPDGTRPLIAFEWIGTKNYLGERGWGKRGEKCTSADFAFRFRRYDGRVQIVLGEWKYTEVYDVESKRKDEAMLPRRLPVEPCRRTTLTPLCAARTTSFCNREQCIEMSLTRT
jgi:hypothetical protein